MAVHIQQRGGTAAQWTAADPVLADREVGWETDTLKCKLGNGVAHWSALAYADATAAALTAEITRATAAEAAEATARAAGDAAEMARALAAEALLIPLAQKGAVNGVAQLGADQKLLPGQTPAIAISNYLGAVGSQAAMLALVGERGDWATRTDVPAGGGGSTWILITDDPTQLVNWKQLPTPTDAVLSVNGRTGVVSGLAEVTDLTTVQAQLASEAVSRAAGDTTHTRFIKVASYTLADGDEGKYFDFNAAAGPLVLTVDGSITGFDQGALVTATQYGSFPLTIAATNGATLAPAGIPLTTVNKGDSFILHKRTGGAGEWMVSYVPAPGTFAAVGIPGTATQAGTAGAPTPTTVWQFNAPSGDTHGPFSLVIGGSLFQSTFDRVMYLGYNAADGGGKIVAAEPKLSFQIESDYDDSTKRVIEVYWEYAKGGAATVADGATTNSSPTVTSATAGFTTTKHVGQSISGTNIPANSYIGVVNSSTSIGLSSSATANVPVNATGTGSAITLTITPSGPSGGVRPIFMQINRANGQMTDFEMRNSGITLTDWNTNATWAVLNAGGLQFFGDPAQTTDTALVLAAQNAKKCAIQLGAPVGGGFLLQNPSTGIWEVRINNADMFAMTSAGASRWGDQNVSFNGTITAKVPSSRKDDLHTIFIQAQTAQSTKTFAIKNAADNAYLFYVGADGVTRHVLGSAAAPAVAVEDAGGNTGIYSPGLGQWAVSCSGAAQFRLGVGTMGFFGTTPAAKQSVTGSLSTVADASAKAVLTSILAALATNYGLVTNGTT